MPVERVSVPPAFAKLMFELAFTTVWPANGVMTTTQPAVGAPGGAGVHLRQSAAGESITTVQLAVAARRRSCSWPDG